VRRDFCAGCDLVVLSKFGRLGKAGRGLLRPVVAAGGMHIPLLTSISPAAARAWDGFAGTGVITLRADDRAIDAWIGAIRPGVWPG